MRVLLVEDEQKSAEIVSRGLTESGFKVDIASYGTEALKMAQSTEYDIIVLDIMIPGIDGMEVLRRLRERQNRTPVIMLTALDSLEDRLQGLKLGADDYIVKPFAFAELIARILTVLRRSRPAPDVDKYHTADLELDMASHKVTRGGVRIDLTPKEFSLLALLMRFQGDVMTKRRIVERIWNLDEIHDSTIVDVQIRRLRAKVDDPFKTGSSAKFMGS